MGRSSGCRSATDDDAYPSGWRYTLHYGRLTPGPETLEDGTLRRYDNAHRIRKVTNGTSRRTRNRN
ncbi:hypothetical protein C485_16160 [Natrinema altunense JCM 12890]|uniref:Uncharacterized protein n=1 Tax=Natrinema altunense (strain JCM 12890 / CGMCC 1.3731 / AJ2) TaxID=1227494 RepID=L9ZC96_NATA2|nr:hypothetical protein C485_16160 [Natrinema altunense JCM 12890]